MKNSDIKKCARCGLGHDDIEWIKFERPVDMGREGICEFWAPCPTNGDPILMAVITEPVPELFPVDWHCQACGKLVEHTGDKNPEDMNGDADGCCMVGSSMTMMALCSICGQDVEWGDEMCEHQKKEHRQ